MELTLAEIAARIGARLCGDGSIRIRGVAGIREAAAGQITFLANPRYEPYLAETKASAVILQDRPDPPAFPALLTREPYLAFLEVLRIFDAGNPERPAPGVHPTAVVAADACLGTDAAVGANAVVCEGAALGARTVLMAGVYVGPGAVLGDDCLVYPNVVIRKETRIGHRVVIHAGAVIGDDGFGFAPDGQEYRKIPQIGRVVIEDDVDIGANTTIDRATVGETRIGRGSRLDNLVMIAHNVEIGENSILCAQVGISGSARIGRHVIMAGQSGMVGHVAIGDDVRIGAQAGVTRSVPAGETWSGYPAQNHTRASRAYAALRTLPEALKAIRRLERRVRELEEKLGIAAAPETGREETLPED